jgi:hypothetical protein
MRALMDSFVNAAFLHRIACPATKTHPPAMARKIIAQGLVS